MTKTIKELRRSEYHQQFGRKLCAAFIAQQQGIRLDTALKKTPEPICDTWLIVAEFARKAAMRDINEYVAGTVSECDPKLLV